MRWAGDERDDPIQLPLGRELTTLWDAGNYVTKLPKAEHEAADWLATMEALTPVATPSGPTMFARIGVIAGVEPPPVASLIPRNHGRF
jgi:hypothetical protein